MLQKNVKDDAKDSNENTTVVAKDKARSGFNNKSGLNVERAISRTESQ